jgi:hypothetical protein
VNPSLARNPRNEKGNAFDNIKLRKLLAHHRLCLSSIPDATCASNPYQDTAKSATSFQYKIPYGSSATYRGLPTVVDDLNNNGDKKKISTNMMLGRRGYTREFQSI